jgi:predicted anti-sigma-YlaC factor YlaD
MKRKMVFFFLCLSFLASCSLLKAADYASEVFMRESDPALAAAALPTMMKASEALYLADPRSETKALTTAQLYVMYANAFLDTDAFLLPDDSFEAKRALSIRAKALYSRATSILVPMMEKRVPGAFQADFAKDPAAMALLSRLNKKDVPLLYWTAAGVLAAFADDPMDFDNSGRATGAIALFEKARQLDPGWNGGALHELAITIYGSMPMDLGGNDAKAREAYSAALAATGSKAPGPFVAYAQTVCLKSSDEAGFRKALETALSLDARAESALMDSLAKRKARRLLDDVSQYF